MKKILLITLLFTGLHAEFGADKYKHAYAGIGIYAGCIFLDTLLELAEQDTILNAKTCLIPVAVAGVGKEIYDSTQPDHTTDIKDVIATVAIPVGSVIIYEW